MNTFHSHQQKEDTKTLSLGPFGIHSFFRPLGDRGGDRFGFSYREGNLYFYLADATGHGDRGAAFWDRQEKSFQCLWAEWMDLDSQRISDPLCTSFGISDSTLLWRGQRPRRILATDLKIWSQKKYSSFPQRCKRKRPLLQT